ncbi:hypothetical protein N657DRAFT_317225 [Parathielavia appendiculata]|uniref:Uncharacterized protein n=1 Tax=Parathielavia appendiculata TaxID=2587402 RepID=A0AAN6TRA9_9PEZI|nr:hypothetical protein N657DRAFT_317225 [Parathielavia appendiculata]
MEPSTAIVRASGHDIQGSADSLYVQPGTTRTVTVTRVSTVHAGKSSCDVVYVPTTVTVYTGCSPASGVSSVSGFPNTNQSGLGPWLNATVTNSPCTHGLPTSTALTTPESMSASLGWNQTALTSRPTLSGTAGTTVQTADPIGTSSFFWSNSSRSSTTDQVSTSTLTLTLTSSIVVTVNSTLSPGPTAPNSVYGTGTGHLGNASTSASMSTAYKPSLTYQTTASGMLTQTEPG